MYPASGQGHRRLQATASLLVATQCQPELDTALVTLEPPSRVPYKPTCMPSGARDVVVQVHARAHMPIHAVALVMSLAGEYWTKHLLRVQRVFALQFTVVS